MILIASTRKGRKVLLDCSCHIIMHYSAAAQIKEICKIHQGRQQCIPPPVFVEWHQEKEGKHKCKNICSLNSFEKYPCKNKRESSIVYGTRMCNMANLEERRHNWGTREYGSTNTCKSLPALLPIRLHSGRMCRELSFICITTLKEFQITSQLSDTTYNL